MRTLSHKQKVGCPSLPQLRSVGSSAKTLTQKIFLFSFCPAKKLCLRAGIVDTPFRCGDSPALKASTLRTWTFCTLCRHTVCSSMERYISVGKKRFQILFRAYRSPVIAPSVSAVKSRLTDMQHPSSETHRKEDTNLLPIVLFYHPSAYMSYFI